MHTITRGKSEDCPTPTPEGEGHSPACVHYDFTVVGERGDPPCLRQKELRENLRQWGILDSFSVTQVKFCPCFMHHEETSFMRQFLSFVVGKNQENKQQVQSRTGIQSVHWENLKCTAMSMDFFDCLIQKGIVGDSGNIRGCYSDVFDGVTVSDKLRELLVNPESENADVFSADQTRQLLFHVFKTLCVGGGVCQPDDRLEAYTQATKALYKDLVSVRKNPSTGELEIAPCKVYRVTGVNGGEGAHDAPSTAVASLFARAADSESPHHVCLVVVDLAKRRASVLRKEFISFW